MNDMIWPVRKLLFIFLLLCMPLQVSWAAVAVYCQHENETTTSHFGHHDHQYEHQHQPEKKKAADGKQAGANAHCVDCHGSYCGIVITTFDDFPSSSITGPPPTGDTDLTSASLPRPERPKWLPAA